MQTPHNPHRRNVVIGTFCSLGDPSAANKPSKAKSSRLGRSARQRSGKAAEEENSINGNQVHHNIACERKLVPCQLTNSELEASSGAFKGANLQPWIQVEDRLGTKSCGKISCPILDIFDRMPLF